MRGFLCVVSNSVSVTRKRTWWTLGSLYCHQACTTLCTMQRETWRVFARIGGQWPVGDIGHCHIALARVRGSITCPMQVSESHLCCNAHSHSQGKHRCPLQGRRAVDLAQGKCESLLEGLLAVGQSALDAELGGDITPAQKALIINDFAKARAHLKYIFQIKLSSWRQVPLLMAGIASACVSDAKAVARECLRQYEVLKRRPVLCQQLFEGPLRLHLNEWLEGSEMAVELKAWLGRWFLIPVTERAAEGGIACKHCTKSSITSSNPNPMKP